MSKLALLLWKFWQNLNWVTPNGGAKCRWGRLNAGAAVANWWLLMWSVINLVWNFGCKFITVSVHPICLQHVCHDAACRAGLSATADPCWIFLVAACHKIRSVKGCSVHVVGLRQAANLKAHHSRQVLSPNWVSFKTWNSLTETREWHFPGISYAREFLLIKINGQKITSIYKFQILNEFQCTFSTVTAKNHESCCCNKPQNLTIFLQYCNNNVSAVSTFHLISQEHSDQGQNSRKMHNPPQLHVCFGDGLRQGFIRYILFIASSCLCLVLEKHHQRRHDDKSHAPELQKPCKIQSTNFKRCNEDTI